MKRIFAATLGTLVLAGGFALGACANDTPEPSQPPTQSAPAPKPEPSAPAVPDEDFTRGVVLTVWNAMTPAEQRLVCSELKTFGPERAAREMAAGAGQSVDDTSLIDWRKAVKVVDSECNKILS